MTDQPKPGLSRTQLRQTRAVPLARTDRENARAEKPPGDPSERRHVEDLLLETPEGEEQSSL